MFLLYTEGREQMFPQIDDPNEVHSLEEQMQLYTWGQNWDRIKFLTEGELLYEIPYTKGISEHHRLNTVSVELSPLDSFINVVRTVSPKLIPMHFGYDKQYCSRMLIEERLRGLGLEWKEDDPFYPLPWG